MLLPTRHVRRLHLRGDSEQSLRRAMPCVSDALHTATLPGAEDQRLILIRHLDLGRMGHRMSAASLALRMERACREAAASAVSGELAGPTATAVTFANTAEALVALARRVARNLSATEWFWPAAVAHWQPGATGIDAWRCLWRAALDEDHAPMVAARLLMTALAADAAGACLAAIEESDAETLLTRCGWNTLGSPIALARRAVPRITPQLWHQWHRLDSVLPATARRLRGWTAALLAVAEHPSASADPSLPERMLAALDAFSTIVSGTSGPVPLARMNSGLISEVPSQRCESQESSRPIRRSAPETGPSEAIPEREWIDDLGEEASVGEDRFFLEPTDAGGLLFCVVAMRHLGFDRYVQHDPARVDTALGLRVLYAVAARLRVSERDPMKRLCAPDAEAVSPTCVVDRSPVEEGLSPLAQRLLADKAGRMDGDCAEDLWLQLMRRWCRRVAYIGLASLVLRPAQVRVTRTHVDVFLSLEHLDIRVRRVGLDVDPGWVPWLGRVVKFHYD